MNLLQEMKRLQEKLGNKTALINSLYQKQNQGYPQQHWQRPPSFTPPSPAPVQAEWTDFKVETIAKFCGDCGGATRGKKFCCLCGASQ